MSVRYVGQNSRLVALHPNKSVVMWVESATHGRNDQIIEVSYMVVLSMVVSLWQHVCTATTLPYEHADRQASQRWAYQVLVPSSRTCRTATCLPVGHQGR